MSKSSEKANFLLCILIISLYIQSVFFSQIYIRLFSYIEKSEIEEKNRIIIIGEQTSEKSGEKAKTSVIKNIFGAF